MAPCSQPILCTHYFNLVHPKHTLRKYNILCFPSLSPSCHEGTAPLPADLRGLCSDRISLDVLTLFKALQRYFLATMLETEQKQKHSRKASRHSEEAPRANIPARQSCQGFLATVLLLEIRAVYWIRIEGMDFSFYLEKDIYKISLD